jgi:hypothetical protein
MPGAVFAAVLIASAVSGCAEQDSDYFGPSDPIWVRVPTTVGDPVYVGVAVLSVAAGDTVELLSVSTGGAEGGASVEGLVSVLRGETRLIGAVAASDLPAEIDLGTYQSLAGARIHARDGPVTFVVRVTGSAPLYGFTELALRFRLNGAEVAVDRFPLRATVCAGETRRQAAQACRVRS